MWHRVSLSRYLGVKPARTTLSLHAIHSTTSKYECRVREKGGWEGMMGGGGGGGGRKGEEERERGGGGRERGERRRGGEGKQGKMLRGKGKRGGLDINVVGENKMQQALGDSYAQRSMEGCVWGREAHTSKEVGMRLIRSKEEALPWL